jgi:hypothetical protein
MKAFLQVPSMLHGHETCEFDPELAAKVHKGELKLADLGPQDRAEVEAAMGYINVMLAEGRKLAVKPHGADESKPLKSYSDITPGAAVFPIKQLAGG